MVVMVTNIWTPNSSGAVPQLTENLIISRDAMRKDGFTADVLALLPGGGGVLGEIAVVMEFDNTEAIKRAIELDAGIGLLPAPSVERELKLGTLICRPLLDVEFTRPVGLIHRRGRELSQAVKRFIHLLVEHRRNSKCSVEQELETLLEKLQVGIDVESVSTTSENTLPEECPDEQLGSKTPDYVGNGKL